MEEQVEDFELKIVNSTVTYLLSPVLAVFKEILYIKITYVLIGYYGTAILWHVNHFGQS